ncbi:hypothetical protein [Salinibacterium sp.]|uniref:hypothetical protein n=1 Tax=Salinibacterium sp. TaxID=1915057 RepID=UPI00286A981A|nr:hypothetical protein [Salinibacterium sp.]
MAGAAGGLGDGEGLGFAEGEGDAVIGRSPRCPAASPLRSDCADIADRDPVAEAENTHPKQPNVMAAPSEIIAMRAAFGSRFTA